MKDNYLLLSDFKMVKDVVVSEIDEYGDEESMSFKLAFTNHAIQRMEHDFGRQCDVESVVDVISTKSSIMDQKLNTEFTVLRDDSKLGVVCFLTIVDGFYTLIVETVIRKVQVIDGVEFEKRVFAKGKVLI